MVPNFRYIIHSFCDANKHILSIAMKARVNIVCYVVLRCKQAYDCLTYTVGYNNFIYKLHVHLGSITIWFQNLLVHCASGTCKSTVCK